MGKKNPNISYIIFCNMGRITDNSSKISLYFYFVRKEFINSPTGPLPSLTLFVFRFFLPSLFRRPEHGKISNYNIRTVDIRISPSQTKQVQLASEVRAISIHF